jgi:hypothetical protein
MYRRLKHKNEIDVIPAALAWATAFSAMIVKKARTFDKL